MQHQQPMYNLQMMRDEPCKEDQNVNIVLRRGITTSNDKGKQPKEDRWVCKALEKEVGFDLACAKETFMEAKKSFAKAFTLGSQNKVQDTSAPTEVDPSILIMFLEIYMKLLCDRKAMKGL